MARISLFSASLLLTALAGFACVAVAADYNEDAVGVIAPDDSGNTRPAPPPAAMSTPVQTPTPAPATATAPESAPPTGSMSTAQKPGIINDLGLASTLYGAKAEGGDKNLAAPPMDYSKATHATINGKSAISFMIQEHIKRTKSDLDNPALTRDERNAKGKAAYQYLNSMASTLRQKQLIPDATYKNMGLTDTYIKDEKASDADALTQLDAALDELKSYQ